MLPLLGTFFVISMTGALSPGPLTTMAIVEGPRRGRWSGWWLSLGHGLVEGAYVAIIALLLWIGRDALLQQPAVAGIVALVGGAFLVWMGWEMGLAAWRHQLSLDQAAAQEARFGLVPTGALVSLSNPYWWIWWALISPLYIRQSFAWGVAGLVILYVVHWMIDLGWLTGLGWLSGSGRRIFSPRVYRWVMIVCGGALLFFGISFVIAGIAFLTTGEIGLE